MRSSCLCSSINQNKHKRNSCPSRDISVPSSPPGTVAAVWSVEKVTISPEVPSRSLSGEDYTLTLLEEAISVSGQQDCEVFTLRSMSALSSCFLTENWAEDAA